jgi:hypothetical protein
MKMSTGVFAAVAILSFVLMSCGGSSSGGRTAQEEFDASYDAIATVFDDATVNECLSGNEVQCDCPGGGTIDVDIQEQTATFNNCKSADENNFDGSFTLNAQGEVSGTLEPFGECSSASVTSLTVGACHGTIEATCGATTITCELEDASGGGCQCAS